VPEGDTIFGTARTLHRALAGQPIKGFETVLPHLARVEVHSPVTGRTVANIEAHGKWLLIHFSSDLILLAEERPWVSGRAGQPCRRSTTPIESYRQDLDTHTTYWCPRQPAPSTPT
jgi:endonuclease VIII